MQSGECLCLNLNFLSYLSHVFSQILIEIVSHHSISCSDNTNIHIQIKPNIKRKKKFTVQYPIAILDFALTFIIILLSRLYYFKNLCCDIDNLKEQHLSQQCRKVQTNKSE